MDTHGLNLGETTGKIELRDNMLLNMGESYLVLNLFPEDVDENHTQLKVKVFGGANDGDIYDFDAEQMDEGQRMITVGRGNNCDIKLNDKLLSKNQSYL